MKKFLRENGLSITLTLITLLTLVGNVVTGWYTHNEERRELKHSELPFGAYLTSGHCIESVFENWESEFLQMGLYVLFTVFLYQKGSSESKDPDSSGEEEVEREPSPRRSGAPWPVRKGGWVLKLYENSLSLAFIVLFIGSFLLHASGGARHHNDGQALKGGTDFLTLGEFMGTSEFWFQSLQNWQSEFLSVLSIVVLSIFLRQKGSPESKPVDAPHNVTGA